ncbi:MAG: TRAP transporter small permease [Deltaproteobacteria bacterium]|nr:TRAP transporter small permease [Candidatus Anaeroferrophillus wilburensis]MBN2887823.1 TRAP transporter small permease [Deltaproteobacteria bacterium]
MLTLRKLAERINHLYVWISGATLVMMMALGFGNVISRVLWRPIRGSFEIIGFLGAVTIALSLGFTQIQKNHVAVDIITHKYSKTWRKLTAALSYMITAPFFLVAAWQVGVWGKTILQSGETSETLRIAYYPFIFIVALGFLFLSLTLFLDLFQVINTLMMDRRKKNEP